MNEEINTQREQYLHDFQRVNQPDTLFGDQIVATGIQITDLLKEKDLTYDGAYASLQYAYNLLKYESNFLKLK